MIPGDLLSAFPHRQFHTLPGLSDSWAALPNSNPNACMPMQGGSWDENRHVCAKRNVTSIKISWEVRFLVCNKKGQIVFAETVHQKIGCSL